MTPEDILNFFYEHVVYKRSGNGWATPFDAERMRGVKLAQDLVDAKTGEAVAEAGQKITPRLAKKLVERSEEHTSELQSLMRISYAVFCLKKKTNTRSKINKHN